MKTASLQGKLIEHVINYSPEFENEMDPIEVMEMLDRMVLEIKQNPTEQTIQLIRDELDVFQIITAKQPQNSIGWLTKPMIYERKKMKRSTIQRILHLLKTGAYWPDKYVHKPIIESHHSITMPIELNPESSVYNQFHESEISKLKYSIITLKETIFHRLHADCGSIGIFQKPDGVINMNLLSAWLEDQKTQDECRWTQNQPLEVLTLDQVVNTVLVKMENSA
ncbi:hypothetical protein ASD24_29595 [Paenibacillus sp. Root52]|nr:hypothetical protein ASD24_29595 [Paenibacillus sp. Root52]